MIQEKEIKLKDLMCMFFNWRQLQSPQFYISEFHKVNYANAYVNVAATDIANDNNS